MQLNISSDSASILFADQSVDELAQLLATSRPDLHIHLLDAQKDGILQITRILRTQYTKMPVQELHIVASGSPGLLHLGNAALTLKTLNRYAPNLINWFHPRRCQAVNRHGSMQHQLGCVSVMPDVSQYPSVPASLSIYANNFTAGDAGIVFFSKLHRLVRTTVSNFTLCADQSNIANSWQLDAIAWAGLIQCRDAVAMEQAAWLEGTNTITRTGRIRSWYSNFGYLRNTPLYPTRLTQHPLHSGLHNPYHKRLNSSRF